MKAEHARQLMEILKFLEKTGNENPLIKIIHQGDHVTIADIEVHLGEEP